VLAADGGDQAAGMLVAAQVDQLEIMKQARLQLDQLDAAAQGFEDRQPLALEAGRASCSRSS